MCNVLSLFDGIGGAMLALNSVGIKPKRYVSSEIDKKLERFMKEKFPMIECVGDVRNITERIPDIDILMGGSPCQGFSLSGRTVSMDDPRSKLFLEFDRVRNLIKPKYYLYENVPTSAEIEDTISEYFGHGPYKLDSAWFSAQTRKRNYWTNTPYAREPIKYSKLVFGDIRERGVSDPKAYYSEKLRDRVIRDKYRYGGCHNYLPVDDNAKTKTLTTKTETSKSRPYYVEDTLGMRWYTPLECERLQCLPDGYTSSLIKSRRYKAIGNGWNINTIAYILEPIA